MTNIFIKIISSPALIGALFGILTFIISEAYREFLIRRKNYREALFRIQMICNDNTDMLSQNIKSIESIIENYNTAMSVDKLPLPFEQFYNLKFDSDLMLYIYHNDFINDYYSYGRLVERENADFVNINRVLELLKINKLDNKISVEDYKFNLEYIIKRYNLLKTFSSDTIEKTKMLLSKSRVLTKTDIPLRKYIINNLKFNKHRKYNKRFYILLKKELEFLENEFIDVSEKAEKDITYIKNKH